MLISPLLFGLQGLKLKIKPGCVSVFNNGLLFPSLILYVTGLRYNWIFGFFSDLDVFTKPPIWFTLSENAPELNNTYFKAEEILPDQLPKTWFRVGILDL